MEKTKIDELTEKILSKLNEIIKNTSKMVILLQKHLNTTFIEDDPNRKLSPEEARKEYFPFLEPINYGQANDAGSHNEGIHFCNCGNHKCGESTGGWHCPVHGQCF